DAPGVRRMGPGTFTGGRQLSAAAGAIPPIDENQLQAGHLGGLPEGNFGDLPTPRGEIVASGKANYGAPEERATYSFRHFPGARPGVRAEFKIGRSNLTSTPAAPRSGSPLALVWRIFTVRSVLRHGSYPKSVVKACHPREGGFHATGRS